MQYFREDHWLDYKNAVGTIDLFKAWKAKSVVVSQVGMPGKDAAQRYLESIAKYQPTKSRQVAALALAQADTIALQEESKWV